MKYDQMIGKIAATAKKIEKTPQRVERSGGGDAHVMDKRTADYQRFNKSGSVTDAGKLFANFFS
jgi:hypothetical protein